MVYIIHLYTQRLDMKKKLLVFHSALAPYRLDFFNSIATIFDCTVVFLSRNNRNQNFDQKSLLADAKFKYTYLDNKLVLGERDLNFGYYFFIKKYCPDIVIGGEFGLPTILPFLYRTFFRNKYKIYTICDDSVDIAKRCKGGRKILRNFLVPRIDGIVLLSNQVADWYQTNFRLNSEPIVFPLIRDEFVYRQRLQECLPISLSYIENYGLKNKRVLLFVGRLDIVKNIELLIKGFCAVAQPDQCLVIVGDGPHKTELSKLCKNEKNKGSIIFTGRFEGNELIAWYNVADILILPSLYEPFGAVVNEALAAGCYVICSCYAGASSLITGNNGIIFSPRVEGEIENAISELSKKIITIGNFKNTIVKPSLMYVNFFQFLTKLKDHLEK